LRNIRERREEKIEKKHQPGKGRESNVVRFLVIRKGQATTKSRRGRRKVSDETSTKSPDACYTT